MKKLIVRVFHKKQDEKIVRKIEEKGSKGVFVREKPVFCMPRNGNRVKGLIDGEEAMKEIGESIDQAKESIYITDWRIDPEIILIRRGVHWLKGKTLKEILEKKGEEGVSIKIIIYESPFFMDVVKGEKKRNILEEKEKIECYCHKWMMGYSQHEKTVIVDHKIGFLGGIDLAQGRWDTRRHFIEADIKEKGEEIFKEECYNTMINKEEKQEKIRLPWHDIHCKIEGEAVNDIERNFIEKWNKICKVEERIIKQKEGRKEIIGTMSVQIVRSNSKEAGGRYKVERGCYEGIVRIIERAEHYIYIEEQFFISNYGSKRIWNLISFIIGNKIIEAYRKKEKFKVIIVVPLWSEGELESIIVKSIMELFRKTIISGKLSLIQRMKKEGIKDIEEYLKILTLYTFGKKKQEGKEVIVGSPIYVHSKCIIVDDQYVFIGSANINDRSLIGERDSEIGAIIVDSNKIQISINGERKFVNEFALNLRSRIWAEHLNLEESQIKMVEDPIKSIEKVICPISEKNTKVYERLFEYFPSNKYPKFVDCKKHLYPPLIGDKKELKDIKGHFIKFPIGFGKEEKASLGVGKVMVE
ncbi:hypothetical protein ENUP19_0184G0011 [Entamoeba nuttalli]|uniref:phospholipase D n=2 Tax=Entamoeba nuttalli TaxID=412467 RepID=K2H4P2_ENTNP|nr:phospholipase D, putative [Entamoeba nuttalli P19]EKE42518.1 phospholipase D, putative [Entamoeba nuttalli P19]|eukprot:XP_008855149.1 phospholipase D, putative [Entamoeba nuttalli P19]